MDCKEPTTFYEGKKILLWGNNLFKFERHKDGGDTLSLTLLAYCQELNCK